MKYDIFISYRRENGDQTAKAIYDRLRDKGYNVYLDVETLQSGAFNEKLYTVIDECQDVLVVLSPNALDRCVNDNDWVRLEVVRAIQSKKNIIPVMLRGFDFPTELPEDIKALRYQNGVQVSVEFFDAFMKKLSGFLKSKPGFLQRFYNSLSWRRSIIAAGVCLLLIAGIWGSSMLIKNKIDGAVYPASQKEKNDVRLMLDYIYTNLTVADNMLSIYHGILADCQDYLNESKDSSYQDLLSRLRHTREMLKTKQQQIKPLSKELTETLSRTKINAAELAALSQCVNLMYSEYDQAVTHLENEMNPALPFDTATRFQLITFDRNLATLDAQELIISICQLLIPVDEKALTEFRTIRLPRLSVISKELRMWSRDETDLTSKEKNIITQQQNWLEEQASIVGKENLELLSEKKILEEKKEEFRKVNSPKDTDTLYQVWGKALLFLRVKMYDEAVDTFQFYLNKFKDMDPQAPVYVPAAIKFVRSIDKTGIDYGSLVTGYEPGKPPHPVFRVGDIIVAVNKTVCRNFTDYERITQSIPENSRYKVTILRSDETGLLRKIDVEIPGGSLTKVGLINLKAAE